MCWAFIPSTDWCNYVDHPLQKCSFVGTSLMSQSCSTVPMGLCWRTYTNTDGLLCRPDLKALHRVYWLCRLCWQERGSLEAAEGFATSSVTLARSQPRDAYASTDAEIKPVSLDSSIFCSPSYSRVICWWRITRWHDLINPELWKTEWKH